MFHAVERARHSQAPPCVPDAGPACALQTRAAKSSSFEDQEVLTGKESELVDELEPCFSRFADYLRARNELLGRMGRMVAAGRIIDDRQPAVLLQPGEHPAIEIRPVGDAVGRVAKYTEDDGCA